MAAGRVLVVDDEPIVGIGFERSLGDHGYQVESVLSGEAALKAVAQQQYDVIFIDKDMPGMDGVEACREIKKISPSAICIFMTGKFDANNIIKEVEFVKAGGKTYYLYKPFAEGEVLQVLQKALSGGK